MKKTFFHKRKEIHVHSGHDRLQACCCSWLSVGSDLYYVTSWCFNCSMQLL